MPSSPLVIASSEIMSAADIRVRPATTAIAATMTEAGVLIRDEIDTLYNRAPDSPVINETLDQLEFYLLSETPAPDPNTLSTSVKRFVASTLETLVKRGELQAHFAYRYIGTLGLESAVLANAADRSR